MCRDAVLGDPLKHLGESLLSGQRLAPRDERRVVGAEAAEVTDRKEGHKECEQGKERPHDADGKENFAIHGGILSAPTAH
jgi:hypothetical protein